MLSARTSLNYCETDWNESDQRQARERAGVTVVSGTATNRKHSVDFLKFPADLVVDVADFHSSGWDKVVSGPAGERYSSMSQALSEAALASIEAGAGKQAEVLWLLADATSMRLTPGSSNQPFSAMGVFGDKRTTLPEDFSDADIDFFHEVVPLVTNPRLQARLADLVWVRKQAPRIPAMALLAIDAYRQLPLSRTSRNQTSNTMP